MHSPFIFGLATSHFDLALLWQSEKSAVRRVIPDEEVATLAESERVFPSWSWCGWEKSAMLYDAVFLDGVFRDTNSWLLNHTWINWNVRDGYGDLRPLWDQDTCTTNCTTESRWRGYSTVKKVYPDEVMSDLLIGSPDSDSWRFNTRHRPDYPVHDVESHEATVPRTRIQYTDRRNHDNDIVLIRKDTYNKDGDNYLQDGFGRDLDDEPIASLVRKSRERRFQRSLPEFPYRVVQKSYEPNMESIEHPLKPILQFHTLYMRLNLVPDVQPDSADSGGELKRYGIADDCGDWCGSIILKSSWVEEQERRSRLRHEFIAISEAMRFSEDECATWTYYIPKEQGESEWDLYYVLLIQYKGDMWERIGVGKVFKEAFEGAKWEEIILG